MNLMPIYWVSFVNNLDGASVGCAVVAASDTMTDDIEELLTKHVTLPKHGIEAVAMRIPNDYWALYAPHIGKFLQKDEWESLLGLPLATVAEWDAEARAEKSSDNGGGLN